ncbi:MAG: alpha/beta hydrolase [Chthoniobacter sp.]
MKLLSCLSALLLLASPALRAADAIPDDVVFESGVEYAVAGGEHLQVDIARPKTGDGPVPSHRVHSRRRLPCRQTRGLRQIVRAARAARLRRDHRHLPPRAAFQFPAAVYDCKAAVRWLRANAARYHVDPARIGVTGGSAGGHLAQFLGVTKGVKEFEGDSGNLDQSSNVACVVNFYGPSDFTKSYGKSVDAAEVLPLWLGGNLETALPAHIRSSPLNWVTPDAAPTLCVHGTVDDHVAYEQATWMIDRLKSCGVEASLLTMEGAGHGFKGADADKAQQALLDFFAKHLKPAKK